MDKGCQAEKSPAPKIKIGSMREKGGLERERQTKRGGGREEKSGKKKRDKQTERQRLTSALAVLHTII